MTGSSKPVLRSAVLILVLSMTAVGIPGSPSIHPGETASAAGIGSRQEDPADVFEGPARHVWIGPDGKPFPLQADQELCRFLESGKVVGKKRIKEGINRIRQILLAQGALRLRAAFRVVEVQKPTMKLADGSSHQNFRDDYRFEVAAYRLSRLLGLDNVPPTVPRRIGREYGSLQVWVEGVITEKDRLSRGLATPDSRDWLDQIHTMRLFDQLIANDDRNPGNILIDGQGKIWMIDHTRSFRFNPEPKSPNLVLTCPRIVWERLQSLDEETLIEEMKGILTRVQINALLKRRDRLVEHIRARIGRLGESAVLF